MRLAPRCAIAGIEIALGEPWRNIRRANGRGAVMILYRGLSFPSATVDRHVDGIRRHGLPAGAGKWKMIFPDLKPRLNILREKPKLERSDIDTGEQTPPWACTCALRRDALSTPAVTISRRKTMHQWS